tara:strand:+ start:177 stop:755 length:579 start_codon:yes stop_codon:yes gene_type:complete
MKKAHKHRWLNCVALTLSASCLTSLLGWRGTSRTKTNPTSQPYVSLKTASQERQESPPVFDTTHNQDDFLSGLDQLRATLPRYLFDAIRQVETGGHPDPTNAKGDGGRSLGPYQISYPYWLDAVQKHPEIGGLYEDVRNPWYAELVMLAYWSRYAPDSKFETLCRIHNGGPRGHLKLSATQSYWEKVESCLP